MNIDDDWLYQQEQYYLDSIAEDEKDYFGYLQKIEYLESLEEETEDIEL